MYTVAYNTLVKVPHTCVILHIEIEVSKWFWTEPISPASYLHQVMPINRNKQKLLSPSCLFYQAVQGPRNFNSSFVQ